MTVEFAVIKRPALFKGEMGLFAVDEVANEEIKRMPNDGAPLWAEIADPKSAKLMRFLWVIAGKLAQGGIYSDKDEAMWDLKIRAKHKTTMMQKGNEIEVARSLSGLSRAQLSRIADRMIYIVCSELIPDMDEGEFRAELEEMLS